MPRIDVQLNLILIEKQFIFGRPRTREKANLPRAQATPWCRFPAARGRNVDRGVFILPINELME
jgi:hypothetical protein